MQSLALEALADSLLGAYLGGATQAVAQVHDGSRKTQAWELEELSLGRHGLGREGLPQVGTRDL